MNIKSVHLIVAPYHVGILEHRVGAGPRALLAHGLVERLERLGLDVTSSIIMSVDDYEGEIGRSFEIIRRIAEAVAAASAGGHFPIVLAGNCNASVGVAAGLEVEDLGFVWFDAHADLDTPHEAVSGYFDGMGVSMLAGQSWRALMQTIPGHRPLSLHRFIYCGVRDLSEPQRMKLQRSPARVIYGTPLEKADFASRLNEALNDRDFTSAVVHLDLDCLDTSVGRANEYAAPGGLEEMDLLKCFNVISTKLSPVALTVASFNPDLEGGNQIADAGVRAISCLVSGLLRSAA
ncbi:MAG: hypothetical protein M1830_009698 [Pleopsidium flavum]|nr:MAG: hypothetical protein M1830_009698 [Pleopsidium flavum]